MGSTEHLPLCHFFVLFHFHIYKVYFFTVFMALLTVSGISGLISSSRNFLISEYSQPPTAPFPFSIINSVFSFKNNFAFFIIRSLNGFIIAYLILISVCSVINRLYYFFPAVCYLLDNKLFIGKHLYRF